MASCPSGSTPNPSWFLLKPVSHLAQPGLSSVHPHTVSSCLHAVYHVGVPHWCTTLGIASSLEELMSQMLNVADVYNSRMTQKGLKCVDHASV